MNRYLCLAIAHFAIGIFSASFIGCANQATELRRDGFNLQWQGFRSLDSERFYPFATDIVVRVVVVPERADMPISGAAGTYSHPQGVIHVVGKMVKGKIVLPEAVTGHEFIHALQFQTHDGRFANPDEYHHIYAK